MYLTFDLGTIILLHSTSLIAGAAAILHSRRRSSRPMGLGRLAVAFIALAIGAALAAFGERAALPSWLWTHLSLLLGMVAYPLLWDGMRRLSGRRRSLYWILILVPVGWFVIGIESDFPLVNAQRASVFHLTAVISLAASAVEIWLDRHRELLPARRPLAACLLASALIYAVRLVCIVLDIPSKLDFATAFFLQIFFNFWIALLVVTLVRERREAGLQLAADTDALTGIGNRRWFLGRLPAAPLANSALAILDVDRFKQINDRFGHPVGDHVLASVARAVRDGLREGDVLARYGGEEFVLFLPNVGEQDARAVAERLRHRIEAMSVAIDGVRIGVTASIGVAWSDRKGGAWDAWIQTADSACYAAKASGRNLVKTSVV
ncbi:GGDEF domain-containing protein [Cupriavidus basilensis]|uniref:diguanylate cyclase n=1 Tax=Cupriavidus basilensis TaxID=68895 RepID=A0ABT6ASF0_9BURK|nr:GGDEF domain-containing protein [Cupriavidus basilensis]MDF3835389.1 GGDEF domain-containing protein [Cupriavidus basilensis]